MTKTQGFVSPCMADSHQECSYVTKKNTKKENKMWRFRTEPWLFFLLFFLNDFGGDRPRQTLTQLLKDYQVALAGSDEWCWKLQGSQKDNNPGHLQVFTTSHYPLSLPPYAPTQCSVWMNCGVLKQWISRARKDRQDAETRSKKKKKKKCKSES